MEITYIRKRDYLYPNLAIDPEDQVDVGKYGQMRRRYLKEHRPGVYGALWIEGKLTPHLLDINETAFAQIDLIVRQLLKAYPAPDRSVDHLAYEEWELNHKLFRLYCLTANSKLARANMVHVSIEYFLVCTDEENDAYLVKGQYKTITGIVLKVDQTEQRITIRSGADTEVIPFSDIYRVFKPTG